MSICGQLHDLVSRLPEHSFLFDPARIPANGIYVVFEEGEVGHGGKRIVRVGTHTGEGQLRSRIKQHFLVENKDRSIFRKNIGRALLTRDADAFLTDWELDLTSAAARAEHGARIDQTTYQSIENQVSEYMQENLTFAVLPVAEKDDRLTLESRIISTVAACEECQASAHWLGQYSPKEKICTSGLWLVNELYKTPLDPADLSSLRLLAEPE
jgi:hypothetical protein